MTMDLPVKAQVRRHLNVAPERVFNAWLDADTIRQWFGPGLGEMTRVDVDPRVGGTFWLVQRRGEQDAVHTGEYLELDRPRRLVFTWRTPPSDEQSRVVIEVAPAPGGSDVTVTHEMSSQWAEFKDRAAAAWGKMTDALGAAVS
jgi:uncharacterized protein YndB with AHSA1/START domain